MVYLHHGQNLHIHAVRANILMSFLVDFLRADVEIGRISTDFDWPLPFHPSLQPQGTHPTMNMPGGRSVARLRGVAMGRIFTHSPYHATIVFNRFLEIRYPKRYPNLILPYVTI